MVISDVSDLYLRNGRQDRHLVLADLEVASRAEDDAVLGVNRHGELPARSSRSGWKCNGTPGGMTAKEANAARSARRCGSNVAAVCGRYFRAARLSSQIFFSFEPRVAYEHLPSLL